MAVKSSWRSVLALLAASLTLSSCGNFDIPDNQTDSTPIVQQNTSAPPSTAPAHQIGLLLPQEGSGLLGAGNAVQAGFMTDYKGVTPLPAIKVYDQNQYQKAVQEGADYIVGPLDKSKVSQIQNEAAFSKENTPIIALNVPDSPKDLPNLIKFSLSPLQEAEQIADRAYQDGHHQALLITPAGDWGQNIATTLQRRWESRGGSILKSVAVNNLNTINDQIKQLLQNRLEADVIFMIVQPAFARQIKPLLNYYHAQNIPVYSTSLVYSGLPDTNKDSALDGVIFCDMPFVLDQSSPWAAVRGNMMSTQPVSVQRYIRLYALGWDAAFLTQHFQDIHQGIEGATGKLSLSSQNEIIRTLKFAVFKNGQPQLLS